MVRDPQNDPTFSRQAEPEDNMRDSIEARRIRKRIQIDPIGFLRELGVTPQTKPPETAD
jgi:hypothetical protein